MVAVAFGSMLQTVSADDSSNTPTITVDGPSKLGIGVKQMYKIVIAGGPAATGPNGTYSWTATMSGKYYSTGKMSSYSGGPTANGTFFVNVTAPHHRWCVLHHLQGELHQRHHNDPGDTLQADHRCGEPDHPEGHHNEQRQRDRQVGAGVFL